MYEGQPIKDVLDGAIAFIGIISILFAINWICLIIDIARSEFTNPTNKTTWIILMVFLAPIAMPLYILIGLKQKGAH